MNNFDTLSSTSQTVTTALTTNFWGVLFAHPLVYLGYLFAFLAAIAFLVFLRGFLSGLPKVITMDAHEEHQEHHRTRITWGLLMMIYLFLAWEIIRFVLGGILGLFS